MSKIFTLSEAGSIAIHSMVLIARSNDSLNVIKIAELTGSSKHHVAKVLQRLAKEDHGGFRLKRSPDQISLLEIYEAIEGKIIVTDCPMDNSKCPFDKCIMENTISTMATEFKNYLDTQKLSDCLE